MDELADIMKKVREMWSTLSDSQKILFAAEYFHCQDDSLSTETRIENAQRFINRYRALGLKV